MKPVPLAGFKIPHSFARNLAEARWGRGGTSSERTTRHGVFYFSCAGHGGYVVDASSLTPEEREQVERAVAPEPVDVLVQGDSIIGVSNPYARQRSFKFWPAKGTPAWIPHPVYLFEEDCDWAVLEHVTGIRTSWTKVKEEEDPEGYATHLERRFREMEESKRKREVDGIPQAPSHGTTPSR